MRTVLDGGVEEGLCDKEPLRRGGKELCRYPGQGAGGVF